MSPIPSFVGAIAAIFLVGMAPPPVLVLGCPPLTAAQAAREATEVASPTSKALTDAIRLDGLQNLCRRAPTAFVCVGGDGRKPWKAEIVQADAAERPVFQYRSDFVQYGVDERWSNGSLCGDCEDYVLNLSERLHQRGIGGQYVRLAVWAPPPGNAAHATLLVDTIDAGVVEVSVGEGGEPQAYDPRFGRRFATLRFDGRRRWTAEPGYRIAGSVVEVIRL